MPKVFDPLLEAGDIVEQSPIYRGAAGEVVEGRFVEVMEKDGVQFVVLSPNDGRPTIALESPGFEDLFNRSSDEIASAYEDGKNVYISERDMKVSARAINLKDGRVAWDVEPLQSLSLSEPIAGRQVAELYEREVIPELRDQFRTTKSVRVSLGLGERTKGDGSVVLAYDNDSSPAKLFARAKDIVGGKQYVELRSKLEQLEAKDRSVQQQLEVIRKVERAKGSGIEVDSKGLERQKSLLIQAEEIKKEYLAASKQFGLAEKVLSSERAEDLRTTFKELVSKAQVLQVARSEADKAYIQALTKVRSAELYQREFRALGDTAVEVQKTAGGMYLPNDRREFEKALQRAPELERPGPSIERHSEVA